MSSKRDQDKISHFYLSFILP